MKQHDTVRLILTTALSDREIAASLGLSKTTVGRYRRVVEDKAITWDQAKSLSSGEVKELLNKKKAGGKPKPTPDFALLYQQLQQKGITLQLLWEEYRREDPEHTLSYSQFAARMRAYTKTLPTVMRQHHKPGERVFVDYSGMRPHYIDPATRKKVEVELFVGVLGASSLMFATCTHTQRVPDFLSAHVAMFNFFGGVPEVVVPDNLKAAVIEPGKTPTLQRSYEDLARHYGVAVLPARPYRPRDKASVESGVKYAQERILARLRHMTFYSLADLNAAVASLLAQANARPMANHGQSRRARFNALERAVLKPLPSQPYEYAEWTVITKVPRDYHVAVEGHFYSVPHELIGKRVDARLTDSTVRVMHQGRCVAHHTRNQVKGAHTTSPSHQTEAHRAQAERTPDGMLAWAKTAGPYVSQFVRHQLDRAQPYLGFPACDALRSLAHKHSTALMEQVVREAIAMHAPNISAVRRLLKNRMDTLENHNRPRARNARGAHHYLEDRTC